MKNKILNSISLILLILGSFYLFSTDFRTFKENNVRVEYSSKVNGHFLPILDQIDLNNLDKNNFLVGIKISDKACSGCFVNVDEYISLVTDKISPPKIYLFIYSDRIENVNRIVSLKKWGHYNVKMVDSTNLPSQRLIFYNPASPSYTYSEIANNVITNTSRKKSNSK
ncbi:MAG: hypothetical protein RLN83_09570 [Balneola sp.]|jgi:hypothetical protein